MDFNLITASLPVDTYPPKSGWNLRLINSWIRVDFSSNVFYVEANFVRVTVCGSCYSNCSLTVMTPACEVQSPRKRNSCHREITRKLSTCKICPRLFENCLFVLNLVDLEIYCLFSSLKKQKGMAEPKLRFPLFRSSYSQLSD